MMHTSFPGPLALAIQCSVILSLAASSWNGVIPPAHAQDPITLNEPGKDNHGWSFDNGREFAGAKGTLALDPENKQNGRDSLKMVADFSGGGAYVQATRPISRVDIKELSFWIKNPDGGNFTLRLGDASGQTHQISLRAEQKPDWQRVVFPLEQFFAKRGQGDTVANVARYEYWGGAKDGKWRGPATYMAIIIPRSANPPVRNFWFANVILTPKLAEAPKPRLTSLVKLDETVDGDHDWQVDPNGRAMGTIKVVPQAEAGAPQADRSTLLFETDFEKGGTYVAAIKNLRELELQDVTKFRFNIKPVNVASIAVQLIDGTGQTHQKKNIPLGAENKWQTVEIDPLTIAGGERWGGAKDGVWHGEPRAICILVNPGPAGKRSQLWLNGVDAEAVVQAVAQPASFKADFEKVNSLTPEWTATPNASVDTGGGFKGQKALLLNRPLAQITQPAVASSPAFPVNSGQWQFSLATRSDLKSPDASYSGTVAVEFLDAAGKSLGSFTLADVYGTRPWQPVSKTLETPQGAKTARFRAQINKAEGQFRVDELEAAYLAPAPRKDKRVSRILFGTAQSGNLLFPTDPRTVTLTVEAAKPLTEAQRELTLTVRDYWGAEQGSPVKVTLERKEKKGANIIYSGEADLAPQNLELGRYYELHAAIPREGDEPFRNFSSLAILPEAPTRQLKPEEVPFTSRSWDNRVAATFSLSDRLGIRIAGIWGGWSEKPPYKPHAPGWDHAKKFGMGWLTGTPAQTIEAGQTKYDETALREGVRNFLTEFGSLRPLIVNLGNEPHGTGERVLKNVEAYRVLYEEIKKVDPTITVVATSVEPNEEYFKAGYGKYCDAFDFHIYETPENVRRTMDRYRELMKQYGVVKPIWSTELGLNSQGLPRQLVAGELYRKFATFFAAGGTNVSWFGILYPDGDGKLWGSSGEAHNVFDTRYNRYAPKLDAIAYYYAVNGIGNKKFVAEKRYPNGVTAVLFCNGANENLIIAWKDRGRAEVSLPLPGVENVQAVTIDGRNRSLNAAGKAISLSVGEDPLLLQFRGNVSLPATLDTSPLQIAALPSALLRGSTSQLVVNPGTMPAGDIQLEAPTGWKVQKATATVDGKPAVTFALTAPQESAARAADLVLTTGLAQARTGLYNLRLPVAGQVSMEVVPVGQTPKTPPAVRLGITNNSPHPQAVTWDVGLPQERSMARGSFGAPASTTAYFDATPSGSLNLAGGETRHVTVPLAGIDPQKLYRLQATATDSTGRALSIDRYMGGFVAAPRASAPLQIDGKFDEADWAKAPEHNLDSPEAFYAVDKSAAPWKGPNDLSARHSYLWDDQYLYMAVKVKDDATGALQPDDSLWKQDGLQLLIDPARSAAEKAGKYDYVIGRGANGPRAYCALSASALAPAGPALDIKVAVSQPDNTGARHYEIAIPWHRLAPFKPAPGANLGLTLALNEDDGQGRHSFMTWFGNAHTKQVDVVGDITLSE